MSLEGAKLQWGRARPHAEMAAGGTDDAEGEGASMGPRASARGNQTYGRGIPIFGKASMGPRASARGNLAAGPARGAIRLASMGPRASARGNACPTMRPYGRGHRFNGAARVRTRKSHLLGRQSLHPLASMGPRASARGNTAGSQSTSQALAKLQWGRARPHAEIAGHKTSARLGSSLQWGRARPHAEIR